VTFDRGVQRIVPDKPEQQPSIVSIALCTYNGARFLQDQLQSFLNQTRLPDELVVCDDRSTDATCEIVEAFARQAPFPVRLSVNDRNLGSTRNFELAISLCVGDLIFLSDQDDFWRPEKVERMAHEFENSPDVALVFSDAEVVDANLTPLGYRLWSSMEFDARQQRSMRTGRAFEVLLKQNVVTGAAMAFRRCSLDLALPISPIWIHDGWIAITLSLSAEIRALAEPLILYRQHGGNQVGGLQKDWHGEVRHAKLIGATEYLRVADQYNAVRVWLSSHGESFGKASAELALAEKISHLQHRSILPDAWLKRALVVLRVLLAGDYHRFSRGWKSVIKDLMKAG
jgi:glycosyltransferase involved in cell wall biosynthesis